MPRNPNIWSNERPALLPKNERRFYEGGDTIPRRQDQKYTPPEYPFKYIPPIEVVESAISTPLPFTHYELGYVPNQDGLELPVRAFKDEFLDNVQHRQVTIVTAETGAGKSTQIPQYLLGRGYQVSMTQPRRIAASMLAERIQDEIKIVLEDSKEYGDNLVGFWTAERNTVIDGVTRISVVTDGLRLVQEFGEREEVKDEVLIIDEVHEWNSNIEMLIARVRQVLTEKPNLRVVIMSATMEADKLATYFDKVLGDGSTKVIEVPGRNHEVTRFEKDDSTITKEAIKYALEGENILIFLPGVREIEDTIGALRKELREKGVVDAVILPLHSKLSQREQDQVKASYPGPKIICATNIAQTSITIPDVNVVIDSGLERRTEIDEEGVQGLRLRPASRADMNQRAGRTGRVAPGTYVHTKLNDASDFMPFLDERRGEYPVPEILRTDVDRNTLIAAAKGIDFYDLVLFHPVDTEVISRSKRVLQELGAIDDEGAITPRGVRMAKMPMRPRYARMLIKGEDEGYAVHVRNQAAAMIAALEVGGMPSWLQNASREWRNFSEQIDSDHIVQLDLFIASREMSEFEQRRIGFDVRNVERAGELHEKIKRRLSLPAQTPLLKPNADEREQLRRVIASGMTDLFYRRKGIKEYAAISERSAVLRSLTDRTSVTGSPSQVTGTPYAIERKRRAGDDVEHVIQDVTVVSPELIGSVALSHTLSWEDAERRWSRGRLRQVQRQLFAQVIETGAMREVDIRPSKEVLAEITEKALASSGPALSELKAIKKKLEELQHLTLDRLVRFSQDDLLSIITEALDGQALDIDHLDNRIRDIMLSHSMTLNEYISLEQQRAITNNAPETIEYEGERQTIRYRSGQPTIAIHALNRATKWTTQPKLLDGRIIKFTYERHEYTLLELQQLARM